MIGDGLSHVSFGTTALATALGLMTPIYIAMPLTVIAAILMLINSSGAKAKGDTAIAMISTGCLAFGYLILNLFAPDASSDACATLFGTGILAIGADDVILCLCLSSFLLVFFIIFYNKIFSITFDEDFASATGTRVKVYNLLIAAITGITVVIAMNMTGALLVSALITFPALSAMRLFKTFKSVVLCAAAISVICSIIGILTSIVAATPIGPTIVCALLAAFVICYLIGIIFKKG
jgi:zinc transport system permease protein